jgi:phosphoribosylformylglycinamidine (FGAM) synthase-like enzyme
MGEDSMMNKIKQWFKSKSINFALVMGALGVIENYTGEVKEKLGDTYGLVYAIIFSIGMIYLRSITTESLKDK